VRVFLDTNVLASAFGTRGLCAEVMQAMDWHISPLDKKLVPNPESPDGPLVPMC